MQPHCILLIISLLLFLSVLIYNPRQIRNLSIDQPSLDDILFYHKQISEIKQTLKNVCFSNSSKTNSLSDRLKHFQQGSCSPIVLVPGLGATRLIVEIECVTLRIQHPEIFQACGWETCSSYEFWKKKPKKEYEIWIGDFLNPASFLSFYSTFYCFGRLIELDFAKNLTLLEPKLEKEGYHVTWFGNTDKTKENHQCGNEGIRDLSDSYIVNYQKGDMIKGFGLLIDILQEMGYDHGITLQSVPYDFRKDINTNGVAKKILKSVRTLQNYTGKKVILIGHSYGNLNIWNFLTEEMSQVEKDEQIHSFLAISPPFLGSIKALQMHLGGNSDFAQQIFTQNVGMSFFSFYKLTNSSNSLFDNYPRDYQTRFEGQNWLADVENFLTKKEKTIFDEIFPDASTNCTQLRAQRSCDFFYVDEKATDLIRINQFNFSIQQLDDLFQGFNFIQEESIKLRYLDSLERTKKFQDLVNPNVSVAIIFGNFLKTPSQLTYDEIPQNFVQKQKNYLLPESTNFTFGDGTVTTISSILPGLKWMFENLSHQNDTKPIKLIEYGGNFNLKTNFYDEGPFASINKNEYVGLESNCNQYNRTACDHSYMIADPKLVTLISQSVQTHQISLWNVTLFPFTEEELEKAQQECPNIRIIQQKQSLWRKIINFFN